ncbi:MAG: phosphate ABC transporter permease PstA [Thermoflexales bacterium]|nr:phosphate ABC transporter permease PstA [Thermoflexales bacterium]
MAVSKTYINPKARHTSRRIVNVVMLSITGLFTLLALVPLVWIIVYVLRTGGPHVSLDLFTKLPAGLGQSGGGVLNAIQSTLVVTLLAVLLSVPVGVLTAFYVSRHPNTPLGIAVRFGTDVLSGVPSIVVGLFGYALMVKPRGHYSALAGGVAIAIIMLPTIIRTTEEMLKLVPNTLREGSLALGAPEWKTSLSVMLPAAISGVVTGIMLALARGVGETAPLLFTVLGNDRYDVGQIVGGGLQGGQTLGQVTQRLLDQPVDGLTLTMWKYAQQPFPERVQQAWAVALVLMVFVLSINITARLIVVWRQKQLNG